MSDSILVVDDNADNLTLIVFLLKKKGFSVRTAVDAESALAAVQESPPRVILTDVQLPGMDGLELTSRLKADPATRDIVIVAVTAYAMEVDEKRALAAGCDGYLAKPIDTRALPGQVAEYLAQARQRSRGAADG